MVASEGFHLNIYGQVIFLFGPASKNLLPPTPKSVGVKIKPSIS